MSVLRHPDFNAPELASAPDATFVPAPADGVLPENFFSTTNLPTYVRIKGTWRMPQEPRMDLLRLSIGSHDPATQILANTILPVGVFNLSITPGDEIEKTNERMLEHYHPAGGGWRRRLMPRTVLVFINEDRDKAAEEARAALSNYWRALEGTLDEERVRRATDNALVGDAQSIIEQMKRRFDPQDRLMLWFDFNNHDSKRVMKNMSDFMNKVSIRF